MNSAVSFAHKQIWITTVINVFGAAAANAAVQRPSAIQFGYVQPLWAFSLKHFLNPTQGLVDSDLFARIFNHSSPWWNVLLGEHSAPVDSGRAHAQGKRSELISNLHLRDSR